MEIKNVSPHELAFIGDAVHTLFVREQILNGDKKKINDYQKLASLYCRATRQSKVLDKILSILSDEEKDIVRRTRNAKIHHSAKNSSSADYKKATCFEALIGYLYLKKENIKLDEFLKLSMEEM